MKLTLDFETFYSTSFSLTKITTMEYVRSLEFKVHGVGIKIDDEPSEYIYEEDVEERLREIWDEYETIELICHNTRFDAYILARRYDLFADQYIDTMSMSAGRFPGQKSNLAILCERLWPNDPKMRKGDELKQTKGVEILPPDLRVILGEYCIQDVEMTYAAYKVLVKNYPLAELDLIDIHIRMFVKPSFVLDRPTVAEYLTAEKAETKRLITESGYTSKQLSSNQQFATVLDGLGLEVPTKISPTTEKITFAFAKNDIPFQKLQANNPQYKHIWAARLAAKSTINRTRAQRMLNAADPRNNKLAVALKYYGAHTGRASGAEKLNFQNLRRGSILRRALTAPKGHKVVVVDSSNIEARVLAWVAGQDDLLDTFRTGGDVYSNFANEIYPDLAPINKKDHPLERFVGKVAVLGLGYGMGWVKFQKTLEAGALGQEPVIISDKRAEEIVNKYRDTNDKIRAYWFTASKMLMEMKKKQPRLIPWGVMAVDYETITLPNAMSLRYPGLREVELEKTEGATYKRTETVYNTVLPVIATDDEYTNDRNTVRTYGAKIVENLVQALARNIVMEQLLVINQRYNVVLTVHDEIICIVPDEEADTAYKYMLQIMRTPPAWAPTLPLDAEGGYDDCYSK